MQKYQTKHYFRKPNAQMAELVDALVSNTSDSNVVPVRPRLWVHKKELQEIEALFLLTRHGINAIEYLATSLLFTLLRQLPPHQVYLCALIQNQHLCSADHAETAKVTLPAATSKKLD